MKVWFDRILIALIILSILWLYSLLDVDTIDQFIR